MSDLIDRQALLKQIDIDSDGEPGYYGDTWKFIDTIKNMPNVHDLPKDTDTISRQAAIDRLTEYGNGRAVFISVGEAIIRIEQLPPAQPEPSQVAKDIARIVGNEQDMRVIQPEIIYCKDCKKQNKDYHMSPYKDTVCPLTAWRGTAQGHEYDYQFCCFAERRKVTT